MKSKLFTNNPATSKEFSKDLKVVADIEFTSDEFCRIVSKSVSQYAMARDLKARTDAVEELRTRYKLTPKEMDSLLRLGAFLLRNMDVDDSVDFIVEDLKTISGIKGCELSNLRSFISSLSQVFISEFHAQQLALSTQASGLNTITGITHLLDLRPILSNRIEMGDKVEDYVPQITKLVPVAILQLRFSNNKETVFQMDSHTLGLLQNELEAIKKELSASTEFVGAEKITKL